MTSGWLLGQILGECLGLLNLNDWNRARAAVSTPFHQSKAVSYVPLIGRRIEKEMEYIQAFKSQESSCLKIKPGEDLKMLAFWILGDILYGGLAPEMEQQLLHIIPTREMIWDGVMRGGLSRYSIGRVLPTLMNRRLATFQREWADFNAQAYTRALSEAPQAPIVAMHVAVQDNQLSRTEMMQTLDEMLFANLDVTIGNMAWIPLFLAAHPSVQEELRREILREKAQPSNWDAYITSTSTLLMACVLESARLKPMAPFSLAQAPPTDRHIDNFIIPAGTNVVVDTHAVNILDPFWGPDNHVFRPDRFLQPRAGVDMRYRYWRYGFGPRQCLGKAVADTLLKSLLAYMVERFEMRLGDGASTDGKDWEKKAGAWINSPAQEVFCKVI